MSRQYSPKTFLRTVRRALLRQYFASRNALITVPEDIGKRADIDAMYAQMLQLSPSLQRQIDRDLSQIGELASRAGTDVILQQAALHDIVAIPQALDSANNHHERSLWTFLYYPELFRRAGLCLQMDRVTSSRWHRRFVPPHLLVHADSVTQAAFAERVRQLYARQGRGRYCEVDYYLRQQPLRHCFFAYPEDYACAELAYDEGGQLISSSRRPTMEVICVYRPDELLLELLAPGGKDYIDDLASIFTATILGLHMLLPSTIQPAFNLEVLRDRSFPFPTEPEDGVESVFLQELRYRAPGMGNRRVTFGAIPSIWRPDAVHDFVAEVAAGGEIPIIYPITGAKLQMVFVPEEGQQRRNLRFDIGLPDSCSLKDEPYDQIAKKYLRRWGIAQSGPAAQRPSARGYA